MNKSLATELSNLSIDIVPWQEVESLFQSKINPILPESPEYFLSPHTQKDLSEICQHAYQHDQPLITCGQGSKIGWGGLVKRKIKYIVSTRHLNKIIEHAQEDLTVTVEAGVKLADLQQTLQKANQFLPLDVAYADTATIGGIIATADAGSLRQRYGGVRDLLLGITFVRADGAIARAGGRVVKNVAGYDLMKLLTGSYGTLGTISEVTLRLYPIPPDSATILLSGSANQINQARQTILNSGLTPTAFDLVSAAVVKQLEIADNMGLLIRFQTIPESIQTQTEQIEKLATK